MAGAELYNRRICWPWQRFALYRDFKLLLKFCVNTWTHCCEVESLLELAYCCYWWATLKSRFLYIITSCTPLDFVLRVLLRQVFYLCLLPRLCGTVLPIDLKNFGSGDATQMTALDIEWNKVRDSAGCKWDRIQCNWSVSPCLSFLGYITTTNCIYQVCCIEYWIIYPRSLLLDLLVNFHWEMHSDITMMCMVIFYVFGWSHWSLWHVKCPKGHLILVQDRFEVLCSHRRFWHANQDCVAPWTMVLCSALF